MSNARFPRPGAIALGLLVGLAAAGNARAAGGHHGVDDAAILESGTCEVESWLTRATGGERLLHAGTGCRVGPVELGIAAEHARQGGNGDTAYAFQAKWAAEWAPNLSAGLSVTSGWQAHVRPRYQATTVAALATWSPADGVALHANLGRDFVRGGTDENRSGVALEWAPREGWTLMAERYVEQSTHFLRAGLRHAINGDWSVDFSRAQRLRGAGGSNWTIGLTHLLTR